LEISEIGVYQMRP